MSIKGVFSHPFVLLIAGAAITGLLVPYITNQWQNHQKELELKTDLATQVSKAVANILISARLDQNSEFKAKIDYPTAAAEWYISQASIGSQLQAYFPESDIKKHWDNLSSAITEFIALEGPVQDNASICSRINHVLNIDIYLPTRPIRINQTDLNWSSRNCQDINEQEIQQYLSNPPHSSVIDGEALVYRLPEFGSNWFAMENFIQNQRAILIQEILSSHIPVF